MKNIKLLIITSLSFVVACQAQKNGSSYQERSPYLVERSSENISIPTSLVSDIGKGYAILAIYINNSVIDAFGVKKVSILDNKENTLVKYINSSDSVMTKEEYPKEVQLLYPYFERYVSSIRVEKNPYAKQKDNYIFNFKVIIQNE